MSPTQRSLKKLRDEGCQLAQVVEHWNPHARIRQDLFGIIDILAIGKDGKTIAIQATASGVSARVKKMEESPALDILVRAGWIVKVHGWRKLKVKRGGKAMRWDCRIVDFPGPGRPPDRLPDGSAR